MIRVGRFIEDDPDSFQWSREPITPGEKQRAWGSMQVADPELTGSTRTGHRRCAGLR